MNKSIKIINLLFIFFFFCLDFDKILKSKNLFYLKNIMNNFIYLYFIPL